MRHRSLLLSLPILALAGVPSSALAGPCEPESPATPVPQFTDEAPGVSLWPIDPDTNEILFRPANVPEGTTRAQLSPLPLERDSTQYITLTPPGEASGHELFQDVGVPNQRDEDVGQSQWMISVYNSGIQVWSLADPEQPNRVQQLDGWPAPFGPDEWAEFPPFGETDTVVYAVDVLQIGDVIYVGVAGKDGPGFTAWTVDPADGSLTQVYQDLNARAEDVALVEAPNGKVYAFAGGNHSVRSYDLTTAVGNGLCVDQVGPDGCDVYRGSVGALPNTPHVSALVVDQAIYIATSDGFNMQGVTIEIWQVDDPDDPATTSTQRFPGVGTVISSPQLFDYAGHHYLALVDSSDGFNQPGHMRVHEVDHCLDADGCADLGPAKADESLVPSSIPIRFLDVSYSAGVPMLHFGDGFAVGNTMSGSGHERLWKLPRLVEGYAPDTVPELTDGGGSYEDPCDGEIVDYFGDYYLGNDYGLNNYAPRHAVFTGAYLYRAGYGLLDVHVRALNDCGDGVVQASEACDDGNADETDGCTSECELIESCGDGIVQAGEACDDGNAVDDDACTNQCTSPTCGDGIVQAGEECDDPGDPDCVDCTLAGETSGETGDPETGGGETGGSAADTAGDGDGCSCSSGGEGRGWDALGLLVLLGLFGARRDRGRG